MTADDIGALFADVMPVRVRRMFGGHGIFDGNAMFALEARGVIYLTTDARTLPAFLAAGCEAFAFVRGGREMTTRYRRIPDAAFDEVEELRRWVGLALAAARPVRPRAARAARPR